MPRKWQQSDTAATTRQKGTRHKRRGRGLSTYARKGKGKHAERYSRPYLTGEYKEWKHRLWSTDLDDIETAAGVARPPRQAAGHNKSKRPSRGINSAH